MSLPVQVPRALLGSAIIHWIWKFTWMGFFFGRWDLHKQADNDQGDAQASWLLWRAGTLLSMDISAVDSWNIQPCKLHGTERPRQDHRAGRRGGTNGGENTGMSSPKTVLPFHWHPRTNVFQGNWTTTTPSRANWTGAAAKLHLEINFFFAANGFYGSLLVVTGKTMASKVQK